MNTSLGRLLAAALALAAVAGPARARTVVTMNTVQIFGTIDPAKISDYTDYLGAVNLYDGLTTSDATGTIVPRLAKSWEIAPDGLTYTFHLNPAAKFQDGSAVTAGDVVYSIKRLMTIDKGPSALLRNVIGADAASALDDHTVKITLKHAFSPFLAITPLLLVLNQKEVAAHTVNNDWGQAWLTDHTASSGPYRLVSWNRGSLMVMDRFADYQGGWPAHPIDELRFPFTNDEATVLSLAASGELTMASQYQAPETVAALAKMPRFVVDRFPTAVAFYLKMNTKKPPTDDLHVRRAIACAVDYDTVREQIEPGAPLIGPLPSTFAKYHLDTLKTPKQDFGCVKSELAQSKYASAGAVKLVLSYVAGNKFEEQLAELMQSTLNGVGFDVTLEPEPWNRITELAAKIETTPTVTEVFFGPTYPSPDSMFYTQYDSQASGTWASMEWLQDPQVDKLIAESRATADPAKLTALYHELQQRISDAQPDAFLLVQTYQIAHDKCLAGYHFVPMQSFDYDFSRMAWDCPK